jgi:hypothetical protein
MYVSKSNRTSSVRINVTLGCVRVTIIAVEKKKSTTYSECVFVALGIKNAVRMRRIILSSVACLAVPYFSAPFHKRYFFRKRKLLNIKCVF